MSEAAKTAIMARRQRKLVVAVSVCALALLIAALLSALTARNDLNAAIISVADIQRQHREVLHFEQAQDDWQGYYRDAQALQLRLEEQRLSADHWRDRGLTVESARMSRRQAQAYLSSLAHSEGYYFVPERFEMRVLQDSDDLLRWREGSTDELELTLVGRYFIRSAP